MNENYDPKKPFIDAFHEQKKELKDYLEVLKKLEKSAPMFRRSPLLERVDDLVHGDPELLSTTFETAVETMDEYIKALNEFSEDQFAAFLMGVGANWLNLPYWGLKNLKFQCEKNEEYMILNKDLESRPSEQKRGISKRQNPYRALPIYNPSKSLPNSDILAKAQSFFKSMLHVLSTRSF